MGLMDALKNLPHELADSLRRASESGAADVEVTQTIITGLKITIKTGEDAESLDLDDKTVDELHEILADLERKLSILQADEPEDEDSEEYDEWEDDIEELEDLIDEVQSAIDEAEE